MSLYLKSNPWETTENQIVFFGNDIQNTPYDDDRNIGRRRTVHTTDR